MKRALLFLFLVATVAVCRADRFQFINHYGSDVTLGVYDPDEVGPVAIGVVPANAMVTYSVVTTTGDNNIYYSLNGGTDWDYIALSSGGYAVTFNNVTPIITEIFSDGTSWELTGAKFETASPSVVSAHLWIVLTMGFICGWIFLSPLEVQ